MPDIVPFKMEFADAANRQQLHSSFYTVWMVHPNGDREYMGYTQRKTGTGLLAMLQRESVQARCRQFTGAESISLKKTATALVFSNGFKLAFGGTIREESARVTSEGQQ